MKFLSIEDVALGVLRDNGLYRYTPGGAFYLLVDISSTGVDSRDFVLVFLEEKESSRGSWKHTW